jgi:hypothetical protein
MKRISLTILLLLTVNLLSYCKPKKEISIGTSYNTITSIVNEGLRPTTTHKYIRFILRPVIRFSYISNYKRKLSLTTFLGYQIIGGRFKSDTSKFKEIIYRHSIELGIFPSFKITKNTAIGIGLKLNYIPLSYYRYYGTLNQADTMPREWITENVTFRFRKFSSNIGFNLKHQINKFSFGFESWFGLSTWGNMNSITYNSRSIENNYRLLVGYSIASRKKQ